MKLEIGTEFNVLDNGEKHYRVVTLEDGYYKTVDRNGCRVSCRETLDELNEYYSDFKIEIISKDKVEKLSKDEIGKVVAYELMKRGNSVGKSVLEVIENSVYNLLIEKGLISE